MSARKAPSQPNSALASAEPVRQPVPSPYRRVPAYLALRFHNIFLGVMTERLASEEIVQLQYVAIATLDDFPGIDQRRLAASIGVDRTTVGHLVDQLEAMGLVDRRINGLDRRARVLRLTRRGAQLRQRLKPKLLAAQEAALEPLTRTERELLMDLLVRVIDSHASQSRPEGRERNSGQRSGGKSKKPDPLNPRSQER